MIYHNGSKADTPDRCDGNNFTGAGSPVTNYHDPRQRPPSCFQGQRTDEDNRQSARPHQPRERREPRLHMSVPRRTGPQRIMGDTSVVAYPLEGVAQGKLAYRRRYRESYST